MQFLRNLNGGLIVLLVLCAFVLVVVFIIHR